MVIAGGRHIDSLYMGPALARLARFPNVLAVPVCSAPQIAVTGLYPGRPTDYLPRLVPSDVLYACGAPGMVEAIKSVAGSAGATCYADPFLASTNDTLGGRVIARAKGWLAVPSRKPERQLPRDRFRSRELADPGI